MIVGCDPMPPREARERWQRPDTIGPYIRTTLRHWGYDVPPVEYLAPPDMTQPLPDVARDQHAFNQKLAELAQRYDLIVGAGLSAVPPFQSLGLNARPMYAMDETLVAIRQTPAGRFNFGRSENRSPPTGTTVTLTGPDGTPRGTQALTFFDQATLINLPGHTSAVAMSMHAIVSHGLDLLEHVAAPGPNWEAGVIAQDVEPDAELNGMQWGNLYRGAHGEPRVRLLPYQGDGPIRGLADADVLVAIPAGGDTLPAGCAVRFLRLGRVSPAASQRSDAPAAADAVSPPQPGRCFKKQRDARDPFRMNGSGRRAT